MTRFGFEQILLSVGLSLLFQSFLWLSGQRWCRRLNFTLAATLLSPTACAVTSMIAGDIALSLGMVGALSIVRFRNPVRSPLELVAYFLLITVGIGSSVESDLAFGLILVSGFFLVGARLVLSFPRLRSLSLFRGFGTEVGAEVSTATFKGEFDPLGLTGVEIRFGSTQGGLSEVQVAFETKEELQDLVRTISQIDPNVTWHAHFAD